MSSVISVIIPSLLLFLNCLFSSFSSDPSLNLWVVSCLGSSCVSPVGYVRCVRDVTMPHRPLAWYISISILGCSCRLFSLLRFLHLVLVAPSFSVSVVCSLIVVAVRSARSSLSSSPTREVLGVLLHSVLS